MDKYIYKWRNWRTINKPRSENHRNLTFKQKKNFWNNSRNKHKKVNYLNTNEIKDAYIGHKTDIQGSRRHGFKKIMPRSKHPKKADDEKIKMFKKLLIWFWFGRAADRKKFFLFCQIVIRIT